MSIKRYGRYWAVYDETGALVAVCVYRKGAMEVVRRLRRLTEGEAREVESQHYVEGEAVEFGPVWLG